MNTLRFNSFNEIHKALRTLMFDTIMRVQHSNLADPVESAPAIAQVGLLLAMMDGHAHHEDHFILHPIEEKAPALIREFESEHVADLALSGELREKIAAYQGAEDKLQAGKQLYYALNAFVAFNLNHMNKEEQLLNQVLWEHYSDQELIGIVQKIKQSVPPDEMQVAFEWIVKGLNNTELLQWLNAIRREAPAFVVESVVETCRRHLPASRWESIRTGFGELQPA